MDPAHGPLQEESLCRWGVGGAYDADLVLAVDTIVSLDASHKLIREKGYKQFEGKVGRVVSVLPDTPLDGGTAFGMQFVTCGVATVEWQESMTRTRCRWGVKDHGSARPSTKGGKRSSVKTAAPVTVDGKITVNFSSTTTSTGNRAAKSAFGEGAGDGGNAGSGRASMFGRREAFGLPKHEAKRSGSAAGPAMDTVDIDWEGSGYGDVQARTKAAMVHIPKKVYEVNIMLYVQHIQERADALVRAELEGETQEAVLTEAYGRMGVWRLTHGGSANQNASDCSLPPVDAHKLIYAALWTQMQLSIQSCHRQLMKRTDKELQRYFAQRYADTVSTLRKSSIGTAYRGYCKLVPRLKGGLRAGTIQVAPSVTFECAVRMLDVEASRATCVQVPNPDPNANPNPNPNANPNPECRCLNPNHDPSPNLWSHLRVGAGSATAPGHVHPAQVHGGDESAEQCRARLVGPRGRVHPHAANHRRHRLRAAELHA